jgi:hypothetical protein
LTVEIDVKRSDLIGILLSFEQETALLLLLRPASIADGAFLSRSRSMRRRLAPILEARRSPVRGILRALGEIAIMTKYLQVCFIDPASPAFLDGLDVIHDESQRRPWPTDRNIRICRLSL